MRKSILCDWCAIDCNSDAPRCINCYSGNRMVPKYSSSKDKSCTTKVVLADTNWAFDLLSNNTHKPKIKKVIFNDPATIVFWEDGMKTVVKCQEGDMFDPEKGIAMAMAKRLYDNNSSYCNDIKKWVEEYEEHNKESFQKELEKLKKTVAKFTIPKLNVNITLDKKDKINDPSDL